MKPNRVFYIDVGNMPRAKAIAHLDKLKEEMKKSNQYELYENIFLGSTYNKVEILR